MAQAVRIIGHDDDRVDNEYLQAQVDRNGNLHVRMGAVDHLNKAYEDTSFVAGDSPVTHDFYTDTGGKYASTGWIMNDGPGNLQVDYSRDGVTFGDKFTVLDGDIINLSGMDIRKLRITHTGTDSAYRVFLV